MPTLRNIKDDEQGTILVFVGICMTVIVGMAALTFDLGRLASTQTDLQAYTDHVALAAAGELDGGSDAITRATAAAAGMIEDFSFLPRAAKIWGRPQIIRCGFCRDCPILPPIRMTMIQSMGL